MTRLRLRVWADRHVLSGPVLAVLLAAGVAALYMVTHS